MRHRGVGYVANRAIRCIRVVSVTPESFAKRQSSSPISQLQLNSPTRYYRIRSVCCRSTTLAG
jgi:hypothetical protein